MGPPKLGFDVSVLYTDIGGVRYGVEINLIPLLTRTTTRPGRVEKMRPVIGWAIFHVVFSTLTPYHKSRILFSSLPGTHVMAQRAMSGARRNDGHSRSRVSWCVCVCFLRRPKLSFLQHSFRKRMRIGGWPSYLCVFHGAPITV